MSTKNKIIEVSRKIQIPKNRIRLFTTDKNGKETGKSRETTNLWTSYGYRNFWYYENSTTTSGHLRIANSGVVSGDYDLRVRISAADDEITLGHTNLNGSTNTSGTRISSYNGNTYHRVDEVTVGSSEYLKITFMFSYSHGSINYPVGQIGLVNGTGNTLFCGTRLNDENGDFSPFTVTDDEQLNVMYSIFIPKEIVFTDLNEVNYWQVTPYLLNGVTPITVSFNRQPVRYWEQSNTKYFAFLFNTPHHPNNPPNMLAFYQGSQLGSSFTYARNFTYSNNNKRVEHTASAVFSPSSIPGNVLIDRILPVNSSVDRYFFDLHFDPPIAKGPNDRLSISFKYTVEIDEVDF